MKRLRNTRQRSQVLKAVRARGDHPSANQIYHDLRETDPKISRGTVYRNLNLLVENGDIRHVKMPGMDRFDWRVEPHYHLLCTECGKACDAPLSYREAMDRQVAEETGYLIDCHRITFEGLCPECRRRRDEQPEA